MRKRITNSGLLPHDQGVKFENPALDTAGWGEKCEVTNLAKRVRGQDSPLRSRRQRSCGPA